MRVINHIIFLRKLKPMQRKWGDILHTNTISFIYTSHKNIIDPFKYNMQISSFNAFSLYIFIEEFNLTYSPYFSRIVMSQMYYKKQIPVNIMSHWNTFLSIVSLRKYYCFLCLCFHYQCKRKPFWDLKIVCIFFGERFEIIILMYLLLLFEVLFYFLPTYRPLVFKQSLV